MRPISEADFPEYPDNRKRRGRRREDQEGYKDMIYTRIAQALFAFLVGIAIGGLVVKKYPEPVGVKSTEEQGDN
jgi:hypothetical protein